MKHYKNIKGNSGVTAFELGPDFIAVQFADHHIYLYNYDRPGPIAVEKMKRLAESGKGLSTYVGRHVKTNFAARLR